MATTNPEIQAEERTRGADPEYPFQARFAPLSAGRMHYVDEVGEGNGGLGGNESLGGKKAETLLFVHGTPTWSFDWRRLIASFSDHYRCVAPDLLGFGHSDRPRGFRLYS